MKSYNPRGGTALLGFFSPRFARYVRYKHQAPDYGPDLYNHVKRLPQTLTSFAADKRWRDNKIN